MRLKPIENNFEDAFIVSLGPEPFRKFGEWLWNGEGKDIREIRGGMSGPHGCVKIFYAADKPKIVAYLATIGITVPQEQK
jgi:hypothetical protein